jgi:hypothetical protein
MRSPVRVGLAALPLLLFASPGYSQMQLTGSLSASQVTSGTFNVSLFPTTGISATKLNNTDISTMTGVLKLTSGTPSNAAASDFIALWSGTCSASTYLRGDGACATPGGGGTVTSVTTGNLSPLFTASFATNTTTPALSFTLSTAAAHSFLGNNTGSTAAPAYVQPAFSDLSGTASAAQLPNPTTSTLGGVQAYTAVTNQFLTSITTSGVPVSAQPSFANLSGTATGAQLPTPQAAALGGIKSSTAGSNQFSTGVDTSGAVTYAQPSFSNLSGSATTGQMPVGVQVWTKYTLPFASIQTAALTNTVTIVALTARQAVCGVILKTTTAFSGNAGGLTMTIGDSNGTATTYSPSPYDLKATVTNTNFLAANVVGMASFAGGNITAVPTSASGNLSTVTAGSAEINVCVVTLP